MLYFLNYLYYNLLFIFIMFVFHIFYSLFFCIIKWSIKIEMILNMSRNYVSFFSFYFSCQRFLLTEIKNIWLKIPTLYHHSIFLCVVGFPPPSLFSPSGRATNILTYKSKNIWIFLII